MCRSCKSHDLNRIGTMGISEEIQMVTWWVRVRVRVNIMMKWHDGLILWKWQTDIVFNHSVYIWACLTMVCGFFRYFTKDLIFTRKSSMKMSHKKTKDLQSGCFWLGSGRRRCPRYQSERGRAAAGCSPAAVRPWTTQSWTGGRWCGPLDPRREEQREVFLKNLNTIL